MRVHGVDLIPEGDRVVVNWLRDGTFEPESVALWLAAVRDGGVALDVGAYTGLYALLAACSGAQAVAYEPNPYVFGRLIANVERNGAAVECRNVAVSDKVERRPLYMRAEMTSAGRFRRREGDREVMVDCVTLELPRRVAAVKIDVEGAELAVLRGAEALLARDRPLVIAEALTEAARRALVLHMTGRGYSWFVADRRNLVFKP